MVQTNEACVRSPAKQPALPIGIIDPPPPLSLLASSRFSVQPPAIFLALTRFPPRKEHTPDAAWHSLCTYRGAMFRYHPDDPRSGLEGYEGSLTRDEQVRRKFRVSFTFRAPLTSCWGDRLTL